MVNSNRWQTKLTSAGSQRQKESRELLQTPSSPCAMSPPYSWRLGHLRVIERLSVNSTFRRGNELKPANTIGQPWPRCQVIAHLPLPSLLVWRDGTPMEHLDRKVIDVGVDVGAMTSAQPEQVLQPLLAQQRLAAGS